MITNLIIVDNYVKFEIIHLEMNIAVEYSNKLET